MNCWHHGDITRGAATGRPNNKTIAVVHKTGTGNINKVILDILFSYLPVHLDDNKAYTSQCRLLAPRKYMWFSSDS